MAMWVRCFAAYFTLVPALGACEPPPLRALVYPLTEYRISSPFGPRRHPISHRRAHHDGVDLAAPVGTAVRAISGGIIVYAGELRGYGKLVVMRHGEELTSHYGHLDSILVRVGEELSAGTILGKLGSTGRTTGPHLHFEIRRAGTPLDPRILNF